MKTLNILQTKEMLMFLCVSITEAKEYLCDIDRKIGDGDHGIGMAKGMQNVKKMLETKDFGSINEVFNSVGITLMSTMGGSSGVVFGSMFSGAFEGSEPITEMNVKTFADAMNNSLEIIKKRGKAEVGDKTMVDALQPAVEELQKDKTGDFVNALAKAAESAKIGVLNTKNYVAKYGRARFLAERSLGYEDAGAVSVQIMFSSMAMWVKHYG